MPPQCQGRGQDGKQMLEKFNTNKSGFPDTPLNEKMQAKPTLCVYLCVCVFGKREKRLIGFWKDVHQNMNNLWDLRVFLFLFYTLQIC